MRKQKLMYRHHGRYNTSQNKQHRRSAGGLVVSQQVEFKMARKPKDVTEAELAIMQLLWSKTAQTVREMAEQLYGDFGPSQNATVQKLLDRLEQKECVQRNRSTWPHTFEAVMQRSDLIIRQLQETADKLCDGSLTPLLTHLVKTKSLSKDERKSLRTLLDELDGKKN